MKLSVPETKPTGAVEIVRMTPTEEKSLAINYAFYHTVFGEALVASTPKGVCYIAFGERETVFNEMAEQYKTATFTLKTDAFQQKAVSLINNEKTFATPLPLHIKGTDFQLSVWEALLHVPLGKLTSYQRIATFINKPKANRATGSAVGSNPVSYLIPCHRVVRSDGKPGGYHWGPDLKLAMIGKERAQTLKS